MSRISKRKIKRVTGELSEYLEDMIVSEFPLTIYINEQESDTLLCTSENLEFLVLGHLKSAWFIHDKGDIESLIIDQEKGLAHVQLSGDLPFDLKRRYITSGCASSAMYYDTLDAVSLRHRKVGEYSLKGSMVSKNMKTFHEQADLFEQTGGVHMAALFHEDEILCCFEDIGRHNAVDKIIGYMVHEEMDTENLMIYVSGRISSEMVLKCIKSDIGVLVSRSAPMDLAVKLAENFGMILIGFARGNRYNIYSGEAQVLM